MLNLRICRFRSASCFFPHWYCGRFLCTSLYVHVCVRDSFVITRLNSDPLLVALEHPPVEKSQFWLQSKRCSIRQGGLHADMHSIRMIYANYAHYSRRNLSSESARINCRKLAIKFTVQGVWGEGRRGAKDIGPPWLRLAWPASPMLGIHGC